MGLVPVAVRRLSRQEQFAGLRPVAVRLPHTVSIHSVVSGTGRRLRLFPGDLIAVGFVAVFGVEPVEVARLGGVRFPAGATRGVEAGLARRHVHAGEQFALLSPLVVRHPDDWLLSG